MASAGLGAPAVAPSVAGESAPHAHARIDDRAAAAWLCAIPCIALVAAVAWLFGPPLGRLMTPATGAYTFTPDFAKAVKPEPTEHARYLIALSLPLLISLATLVAPRWLPRVASRIELPRATVVVQALLAAFVVACYVAQVRLRFGAVYTQDQGVIQLRYFKTPTLLAAAALVGATLLVLWQDQLRRAALALMRDTRARRAAVLLIAVAATAIWLLHAVQTDRTLANEPEDMRFHIAFPLDETFAVLNGLTPLVDFSAQYGSLWPFLVSLPMLAFGKSVLTFTLVMSALTGLALLSIFGVLRRVARSPLGALLLYLPFLASSLFFVGGTLVNRTTVGTYNGTFPLRYAGPYFLAWLTARHIDRDGGARGVYLLFLVGGLTILNNADFGVAALGASVAAFVWSGAGRPRPPLRRLALAAGGGLLTALALVSLLTLVRAGSLPHLDRLVDYARLFTVAGFAMMPVPGLLGLHVVIYLTYVAAIAVATVRALRHETDRLLTGMLAWSGIFGLGSASYYIGRSHPVALKSLFSVWALTLALLTVVVVRQLAAHPQRRRISIAAATVLFGFGVAACSLAQTPAPWSQIERFGAPYAPNEEADNSPQPLVPPTDPAVRRFVATLADGPSRFVYKRGAPVAILLRTGHRVADAYGVRNVAPYTGIESTPTIQRVEAVLDALERAGGNTLILPNPLDAGIFPALERRGFRLLTHHGLRRYDPKVPHSDAVMPLWPYGYVIKWVDTRHLHPRALDGG